MGTAKKKTAKKKTAKKKRAAAWENDVSKAFITLCSFDQKDGSFDQKDAKKALSAALKGCTIRRDDHRAGPDVIAALVAHPLDAAWLSSVRVLSGPPAWALAKIAPAWDGEEDPLPMTSFEDLHRLVSLESIEYLNLDRRKRDADLSGLVDHPTLERVQVPSEWRKLFEEAGFAVESTTGKFGWAVMLKQGD